MSEQNNLYVITDMSVDDVQALYYLYNKGYKIKGVIIDRGTTDTIIAYKLIIILNMMFKQDMEYYFGITDEPIVEVPEEWMDEVKYAYEFLNISNVLTPSFPMLKWKTYKDINFTNATIISFSKATVLKYILENYTIKYFYAMIGGTDEQQDMELNQKLDPDAYDYLVSYLETNNNGVLYKLDDITQGQINKVHIYEQIHPLIYQVIKPPSRPTWKYWDLLMVMKYF